MEHHAYLILGTPEARTTRLEQFLQEHGVIRTGNPDIHPAISATFVVDDARAIAEKAIEKAFGDKKIIIIDAERYTESAQNALLKTLEDPVANTHFFVLGYEESIFLPTLLSRLHRLDLSPDSAKDGPRTKDVDKFLATTAQKRVDFAKRFADKEESLPQFLDALLETLKKGGAKAETLKRVLVLREYASDNAVNSRLILEHLGLVI